MRSLSLPLSGKSGKSRGNGGAGRGVGPEESTHFKAKSDFLLPPDRGMKAS